MNSTTQSTSTRQRATKEVALLVGLLFLGMAVVPIVIFEVGQTVFGTYAGVGFSDFFSTLSSKVRSGDKVAWFLILSPYLGWQCLRLMALGWRLTGSKKPAS